jgi:hypothetical protein
MSVTRIPEPRSRLLTSSLLLLVGEVILIEILLLLLGSLEGLHFAAC